MYFSVASFEISLGYGIFGFWAGEFWGIHCHQIDLRFNYFEYFWTILGPIGSRGRGGVCILKAEYAQCLVYLCSPLELNFLGMGLLNL